jgi:hypothetical protein
MSDESPKTKPLDYVMVRHMGYSAETKAHRSARAGQRKQRMMLDTGRRIRCKGGRYTEVTFSDVLANFNTLLAGVRSGAIRVCRPDNLAALTMSQFVDLGARLAEDFKVDLRVDNTLLEPLVADQADTKVWVPKTPEVVELEEEAPKSEEAPTATLAPEPAPEPALVSLPVVEETKPMVDSPETTEWDEEALQKLSRSKLNKVATESFGIENPGDLPSKQAVIDAIFAASGEQE